MFKINLKVGCHLATSGDQLKIRSHMVAIRRSPFFAKKSFRSIFGSFHSSLTRTEKNVLAFPTSSSSATSLKKRWNGNINNNSNRNITNNSSRNRDNSGSKLSVVALLLLLLIWLQPWLRDQAPNISFKYWCKEKQRRWEGEEGKSSKEERLEQIVASVEYRSETNPHELAED